MRRIIGITVIISLLATSLFAQIPRGKSDNKQGSTILNFGLGTSGWGVPIYIQGEQFFYKELSIGIESTFRFSNEVVGNATYHHNMIAIGGLCNYYFDKIANLPPFVDLYSGVSAGFVHVSSSTSNSNVTYSGSRGSGLYLGLHVGGRYYFSDTWAAQMELEFGTMLAGLKIGATYRF
ncbi:MAG: hypothetical protein PHU27_12185 [Salinivirgaceae bacterium]|nr:hypothetical protein [Salinivirgaceae bacterium]